MLGGQLIMHSKGLAIAVLILGMFAVSCVWGQTYYKWKDTHGVTHYSEQPPAGHAAVITVRPGVSEAPATAATVPPASNPTQALDAAAVRFRKQACVTAKENLKLLASGGMVVASGTVTHPAGVEAATKLSSDQRDAAKVTAQKNVDTYCSRG